MTFYCSGRCPLRVISDRPLQRQGRPMSALAPIGDKTLRGQFVREVPIANIAPEAVSKQGGGESGRSAYQM